MKGVLQPAGEASAPAAPPNRDLRRRVVAITISFWLVQYLVLTIGSTLAGLPKPLELATGRIAWIAVGLVVCGAIYLVLQRLQARSFGTQVVVMMLLGVPAALVQLLLNQTILYVLFDWPFETGGIFGSATYWIWFYLAWAAAALAAIYSERVRTEQRMRAKAQELAHKAQMRTLRYQLNPHFLFNTLNSVAALILDQEPEKAEQMIGKLAAFLRSGLDADPLQDVMLRDELAQQLIYLDIERARFPERLVVDVRIPEDLCRALVPGFILQPPIENCIKHVVAHATRPITITIEAVRKGEQLVLSVEDDGPSSPNAGADRRGVGLANTKDRLAARFGSAHRFEASGRHPHGFRVELAMPLITA